MKKLEVGKRYVVRNPEATGIKYVRVDAIREDITLLNSQVAVTEFFNDGVIASGTRGLSGSLYLLDANTSKHDLVAEYKEPELHITEKDVGKRVRLRNGWVTLVTGFDLQQGSEYKIKTCSNWVQADGRARPDKQDSPYDIVEILD